MVDVMRKEKIDISDVVLDFEEKINNSGPKLQKGLCAVVASGVIYLIGSHLPNEHPRYANALKIIGVLGMYVSAVYSAKVVDDKQDCLDSLANWKKRQESIEKPTQDKIYVAE